MAAAALPSSGISLVGGEFLLLLVVHAGAKVAVELHDESDNERDDHPLTRATHDERKKED